MGGDNNTETSSNVEVFPYIPMVSVCWKFKIEQIKSMRLDVDEDHRVLCNVESGTEEQEGSTCCTSLVYYTVTLKSF